MTTPLRQFIDLVFKHEAKSCTRMYIMRGTAILIGEWTCAQIGISLGQGDIVLCPIANLVVYAIHGHITVSEPTLPHHIGAMHRVRALIV